MTKMTDLNMEEDISAIENNHAIILTNWRDHLCELEMKGEYLWLLACDFFI